MILPDDEQGSIRLQLLGASCENPGFLPLSSSETAATPSQFNEQALLLAALLCTSKFEVPSELAMGVLLDGIMDKSEQGSDMITRVAHALFQQEFKYDISPESAAELANEFITLCDERKIVMGTPILTNAGRHIEAPLSSCSVLPDNFEENPHEALKYMHAYWGHSIGLGIDLGKYKDPMKVALEINAEVLKEAAKGNHERRIGNMGTISVRHPRILDVIRAKINPDYQGVEWRFNFSIDCDEEFMAAVESGGQIQMEDGSHQNAAELMRAMTEAAARTGDPGLIFLDRLNNQNPTPGVGRVRSTAPCAEVGLIEGEACQFGYINLGKFVQPDGTLQLDEMKRTVYLLTRSLDNALDVSIDNLAHPSGQKVMRQKRKIGIGVCGLADMFAKLQLSYESEEARELARDLLALISYVSKVASVELAEHRGAAEAMNVFLSGVDNRHLAEVPMLLKYARDTRFVTDAEWQQLADRIKKTRQLRNVSTIALPPTGRSSLIIDASNGIEPWFTVIDNRGEVQPVLRALLEGLGIWSAELEAEIKAKQTIKSITIIPESIRKIFKTATELDPDAHLLMTAVMQEYNDESISKTVNMPAGSTPAEVQQVYLAAHRMGLCGITIYVDGSRSNQPKQLTS